MGTAEGLSVHDLTVLENFELVESPNTFIYDEFLETEMTALAWAVYFGYDTGECLKIIAHASRQGADPFLRMRRGFFQGQTVLDIVQYFSRAKLVEQLESMEAAFVKRHPEAARGNGGMPNKLHFVNQSGSFRTTLVGGDLDPNTYAENELEILKFVELCGVPEEDCAILTTALMSTHLCSLQHLKHASLNELLEMELGDEYSNAICDHQHLISGETGKLVVAAERRRASSFNAQPPSGRGDEAEDNKLAIAGLERYILAKGGSVVGCKEKRDYEQRALELDAQAELRKRYGLDTYVQQAKIGLPSQDTGVKGILSLTLIEGNEHVMLHYPGLTLALVQAAHAGETVRIKYLALKALFNLSVNKRNLKEMFEFDELVNVLIDCAADGETVQIQATALNTLVNITHCSETQRELFRCDGLVELLMEIIQQVDSDDFMREAALDCLNNLAMQRDNQVDMVLHFGMIELLTNLAQLSTSANMRETALACLHNLAFAKENQRILFEHDAGRVVDCFLFNAKKSGAQSVEIKQAALGALGNLAQLEENRVPMFAHPGLIPCICQACGESENALLAHRVLFFLSKSVALRHTMLQHFQISGLLQRGKKSSKTTSKNIALFCVMSLANLRGGSEERDTIASWDKQDFQLIISALKSSTRGGAHIGWELCDVLVCLQQLSVVAAHRRVLFALQRDFLDLFLSVVEARCDEQSTVAALNCITYFTFEDREPIEWIKANESRIAQCLSTNVFALDWAEAKYSAGALLFRLKRPPVNPVMVNFNKVTLLYHAKNLGAARSVANQLKGSGYEVWLDEAIAAANTNQTPTSFFDALFLACKTSQAVLVIVSKAFKESAPSRVEFTCAKAAAQFKIIPLIADREYEEEFMADGWLGAALTLMSTTQAYYTLFGDLNHSINALMERELVTEEVGNGSSPSLLSPLSPRNAQRALSTRNALLRASANGSSSGSLVIAPSVRENHSAGSSSKVPNGAEEIRAWLQDAPEGETISQAIINEGLVTAEDLALLAREPASEVRQLVPTLNSGQILRLKEMLATLFPASTTSLLA